MEAVNDTYSVLSILEGVDSGKCRKVMLDYDNFINGIQHKMYVQNFIEHYRDAETFYLKGNEAGEKISLIFALNLIEMKEIQDYDLEDRDLHDYVNDKLLTSDNIRDRLNNLEQAG